MRNFAKPNLGNDGMRILHDDLHQHIMCQHCDSHTLTASRHHTKIAMYRFTYEREDRLTCLLGCPNNQASKKKVCRWLWEFGRYRGSLSLAFRLVDIVVRIESSPKQLGMRNLPRRSRRLAVVGLLRGVQTNWLYVHFMSYKQIMYNILYTARDIFRNALGSLSCVRSWLARHSKDDVSLSPSSRTIYPFGGSALLVGIIRSHQRIRSRLS